MALIQRPVKTLGNREYAQEKAANPNEPIKSAEVDGDLDTIYALVNGQLDTTNLKASANIVGTQLAAGANILGSQLSPSANIAQSQLAPGAIGIGQIAPGATVQFLSFVVLASPTSPLVVGTETLCLELPWTSRGGHFFAGAALHGVVSYDSGVPAVGLSSNMRLDGTAGVPTDGSALNISTISNLTGTYLQDAPITLVTMGAGSALAAGTHRIKVTAILGGRNVGGLAQVQTGVLVVLEMA